MNVDSGGFARLRSEKISGDDQSLLSSNPNGKNRFPTNRPTKRLKKNSTADSGDFARLPPKSIGVWSENFSGDGHSLLFTDPIKKL